MKFFVGVLLHKSNEKSKKYLEQKFNSTILTCFRVGWQVRQHGHIYTFNWLKTIEVWPKAESCPHQRKNRI